MSELPSGTVTFLFTDIQGSTQTAQQYPEALPSLLARHNTILSQAIESHNGHVFRIVGDAFCAAFRTPGDALNAAVTAQRALQHETWSPARLLVRMGLHTGQVETDLQDSRLDPYVGYLTLTRVQRVMSAAHGGQILLSNSTAELVRSELPPGVSLRDMGEHKLKGLINAEHLWQIVSPDLKQDFAPLESSDIAPSNLPTALNRLVGRERELEEVQELLDESRLVTLLGPGGTGKTRLALQVAWELRDEFQDRVYFVDLASSRNPESVLAAIGRTVGLREKKDRPLLEELKAQIRSKKMLSLLDNFEQVTVAGPAMAELLRDCPELRMLVTSREALHVRGENVFPVPPLELPETESRNVSLDELKESSAVQLFTERATAVKPDFRLTRENAAAVAEICVRLDGLPLALELAAARLNVFTPQALAERLGNRLKLLRGGARDLPERQQTLRDTIDWSYDLLDANEQDLFELLSVFSGATIEAIEAVASRLPRFENSTFDILEGVSSLVDQSLIRQTDGPGGDSRLRMLETIREFAAYRLGEDETFGTAVCRAHAEYFADFTSGQWARLSGPENEDALADLTADLENIQTAWRYWVKEGNLEQLGKFTNSLWLLYDARSWYHATVQLTSDLLAVLSSTVSTPERARQEITLQTGLARALLSTRGYTPEVEQAYARALELCASVGEIPELFPVLRGLSVFYILRGEFDKGVEMGQRIVQLAERLDDPDMLVEGHLVLGENLGSIENLNMAIEHLEKAIALYDPSRPRPRRLGLGSNPGVISLVVSGLYLWMMGFAERAVRRAVEAVTLARKLDHPFSLTYALFHHGLLSYWLGDTEHAQQSAREVLDLAEAHEFLIWRAASSALLGASLVRTGSADEGLALIANSIAEYRGLKSPPIFLPLLLYLYASSYRTASRPADGLRYIDQAIELGSGRGNEGLASELLGLKAELMLAISADNAAAAEEIYLLATDLARRAGAQMFELRIAIRLSRLWLSQGKRDQARAFLKEIYGKFTEGFATPDLVTARKLLEEMS